MVLPAGKKTIETRWVYALKYKDDVIYKYKARLVAKGYEQIYGVDFEETFAPVALGRVEAGVACCIGYREHRGEGSEDRLR